MNFEKKEFKKGLEYIISNKGLFLETIVNSYKIFSQNKFYKHDSNVIYTKIYDKKKYIEIIGLVSEYDFTCIGIEILKNINGEGWKYNICNKDTNCSNLICESCDKDIDFTKGKFYSNKSIDIELFDICIDCHNGNNMDLKEINVNNLNFFGINTYSYNLIKYYSKLSDLYNNTINIKNIPIIEKPKWIEYDKYCNLEYQDNNNKLKIKRPIFDIK